MANLKIGHFLLVTWLAGAELLGGAAQLSQTMVLGGAAQLSQTMVLGGAATVWPSHCHS